MRPTGQHPGFTLLELVTATTLTVLVAGSTVAILSSSAGARRRADRQLALQQQARAGLMAIATALSNAYRYGDKDTPLEGLDDWLEGSEIPADRIRFSTVSLKTVRWQQPESDIKECEFFLSEPTEQALPALMRRTDPTRNETPDGGGVIELVAENVLGLNFTYHDGLQWCTDWPQDKPGWPLAVRIELAVLTEAESTPPKVWTTSRMVHFPLRAGKKESRTNDAEETADKS